MLFHELVKDFENKEMRQKILELSEDEYQCLDSMDDRIVSSIYIAPAICCFEGIAPMYSHPLVKK